MRIEMMSPKAGFTLMPGDSLDLHMVWPEAEPITIEKAGVSLIIETMGPKLPSAEVTMRVETAETLQERVKSLEAEVSSLRVEKERFSDEDDQDVRCDVCGESMEHVRPGKWQCNRCDALRTENERQMQAYGEVVQAMRAEHNTVLELRAEIERLNSWDGLMSILDHVYPESVFDGSSGDSGSRIIVLLREINALRQDA